MKKLILFLAIAGFVVQLNAQPLTAKEVPTAVTTAFYKTYPTVENVNWSKDVLNYEAGYVTDEVNKSATYDVTGKLIKTQLTIVPSALPALAMEYVKINYKEEAIKFAYKITDASYIVTYEVEVKGMELTFDSNGKFMNSIQKTS